MDRPPPPRMFTPNHRFAPLFLAIFLCTQDNHPRIPLVISLWTLRATYFLLIGLSFSLAILATIVLWRWFLPQPTQHRTAKAPLPTTNPTDIFTEPRKITTQNSAVPEIIFRSKREMRNLEIDTWLDADPLTIPPPPAQIQAISTSTIDPIVMKAQSRSRYCQCRLRKPREGSLSPRPAPGYVHPLLARSEFARVNFVAETLPARFLVEEKEVVENVEGMESEKSVVSTEEELVGELGMLGIT